MSKFRVFIAANFLILLVVAIASAQQSNLITASNAGPLKIGMTVAEARKAMPGYVFERTSDGEGVALIGVGKSKKNFIFTIYAGEEDADSKINEKGVIEFIEVWNKDYKLANGIHPGMKLADVEKILGPVKKIFMSEIEAREYAEFMNFPEGISIRLSSNTGTAGNYPADSRETTKYAPDTTVFTVGIQGDPNQPKIGFFSEYTDLKTECKEQKVNPEEGGHVSTYCDGPEGYKIHMFDSASTMEVRVETPDEQSIPIASEALGFNAAGRKIEWRFRSGNLFAVIMRVNTYKRDDTGMIKYPVEIIGEKLIVRGLPGFESINGEVDAKSEKGANEKARKIADDGYDEIRSKFFEKFSTSRTEMRNQIIFDADKAGEEWVRSPIQVAMRITGEFAEMRRKTMEFEAPTADGATSFKLIVTNEGLADDSVHSERFVFELKQTEKGVWFVESAKQQWKCQTGRGSQEFMAKPCS
ncbi:MAG: hypothetical protein R2684_13720 [Pyrinomonadaceae bacterium]